MEGMLRALFGGDPPAIGEFAPCATYYPEMDWLLYLEEDCSYVSRTIPGSNVELLLHPDRQDQIIGVKISQFSLVAPKRVVAAYREPC